MSEKTRPFEDMVERIARIDEAEFAGAIVVMPPTGDPVAFLTTDPAPDLLQFWATVKQRIEIRAAEAIQAASKQDPWARH